MKKLLCVLLFTLTTALSVFALDRETINNTVMEFMNDKNSISINITLTDGKERDDLLREAFSSDYFITSSNAISMDGALYNIDGTGNRVAAMCFGPKNVLVICGLNKICENEEDAKYRVRNIAAVANTIRFNKNAPCTKIGYCVNCECEDRICDSFVKIDRSHVEGRIHIIFVKENLGF